MEVTRENLHRYYADQKDDERRMYKADRLRSHAQSHRLREIANLAARHLPFSPDARVLDLGCGDGYATGRVLEGRPRSTCLGLDLSIPKLKSMRGRFEHCCAAVADAEGVPLKSASFDIILCLELIEHVLEPVSVLKEIRRLLRPNGRCLISTPADSFMQPTLVRALSKLKHRNGRGKRFNEHLHFTSFAMLRPMFQEARLGIVARQAVGFQHPLRSFVASRMRSERLIEFERWLSRGLPFGSFGAGPLTFGNEYLVLCARPI